MVETVAVDSRIEQMSRGGPNASSLDRRFQTNALEYTDHYDIPHDVKQTVISALDRVGARTGQHEKYARLALDLLAGIPHPRVLELVAGHGKLSAKILELHSTATVTVSDLDPTSVANIANSDLGAHPRVRTQVVNATPFDANDRTYDLAVFAQAFHRLPPATAVYADEEATKGG